jgi:hypothetical protein
LAGVGRFLRMQMNNERKNKQTCRWGYQNQIFFFSTTVLVYVNVALSWIIKRIVLGFRGKIFAGFSEDTHHRISYTFYAVIFIRYKIYMVNFLRSLFIRSLFIWSIIIQFKIYTVQNLYSSKFIQFKIYTVIFDTVQNVYSSKFIRYKLYTCEKNNLQLRIYQGQSLYEVYLVSKVK